MFEQILTFTVASLLIIVIPGPDFLLLVRNTVRGGNVGAVWTATGIMVGNAVLAAVAAVGLTALLLTSTTVFAAVRIAGGVYLAYLGVQALRSYLRLRSARSERNHEHNDQVVPESTISPRTSFRQGLLCNVLNPKVAAFYVSLFPQFDLTPFTQHALLACMFWGLALLWYITVVVFLGRLGRSLRSPVFARRTEGVAGSALIGLGGYILTRPV
ncbi:LysE family translocator [Rhodococcus sp. NPDC057014]|uniref:LysE family translocator n=1 Tax=Rhodococcus sp. NPDC057014 TaxID=3346000 RepID=UPI00363FBEBA